MQRIVLSVVAVLLTAGQAVTFGQAGPGKSPGAAYFTVEDQQTLYSHTVPDKTFHQGALVWDAGDYNIGINAQHQVGDFGEPGTRWNFHSKVTEIYVIVEGTATSLTVGGPMSDIKTGKYSTEEVRKNNGQGMAGPGGSASFANKPQSRQIKKGDVLVIPPYTGHELTNTSKPFRFLVVRVDPERTLPTGFVNKYLQGRASQ